MGTFKKTQCDMCAVSCGIEVEVENDEIVNIRPDPDSPRTSNYMCRKGRAAKYFVHNPDRLNYPMKRVGDHFERISWEQAYREIAEKANAILKKHGPRAFAFCGGTLASEQSEAALGKTFVAAGIGSQYWYCPIGLEFMGSWWSHGKVLGHQMYFTEPDEKRNEVLILWGSNSYVSHQMADARKIIRKFSQDPEKMVITVDPRLSESARMSDLHVPVRNGTDALFLRGLIALILEKGWEHRDYLAKYAADWDKAKRWYTGVDIDETLRVSGVSRALAEKFAHILTHKKWGMHQDLGVFCSRHNTVACYELMVLMAVCGVLLGKSLTALMWNRLRRTAVYPAFALAIAAWLIISWTSDLRIIGVAMVILGVAFSFGLNVLIEVFLMMDHVGEIGEDTAMSVYNFGTGIGQSFSSIICGMILAADAGENDVKVIFLEGVPAGAKVR